MKFTDGQWMLQPGVSAHYACEAYDIKRQANALVISATTRVIRHRGDTLQGPLLTVRLSSPLADVVKVRIEHFSGVKQRAARIPLQATDERPISMEESANAVRFRSGELEVQIGKKENWGLTFEGGGRFLTRSGAKGQGYIDWPERGRFIHEQLSLAVGECVYGLGERFTALVKNGQVVENTNKDGGTACDQAYKAVPFYLTNRGYGVLVNEAGPVSFEVASEKTTRVQFSLEAESIEYFLIYGPTPKEILGKLTALTGRPALPPSWTFGLWLSTSFTTNYDEKTTTHFLDEMKRRDLPLSVFHFDCFWMREFNWCDFEWDARMFPDPIGMLRRLHDRGLKICLWINPYIAQRSPLFAEAARGDFLIKKINGDIWQSDLWQPGMGIVDFTNPAATTWFQGKLRHLLQLGVDTFKTDFGERIPTQDVVYHDGSDPVQMHNLYSIQYNETVFSLLKEVRGESEAVVFARSTYASGQRFPIHWGGDCWSTFESMAESLRGGLSLGLCGFGFWSHDIGGFEGLPPAAVYKRWLAFGLLSSHSRLHGSSSYRVPWNYDDEACDVLRVFTKLKARLMPYLFAAAIEAHRAGVPMMRAMMLEFPEDPACDYLEQQYLLGSSLLVAPVLSEDGNVRYYLPAGRWTHLLTGEVQLGGQWQIAQHGFLSLPLFVRPNTLIAWGHKEDRPDYNYTEDVTIAVYELDDGKTATCALPTPDGNFRAELTVRYAGRTFFAEWKGAVPQNWKLLLVGRRNVRAKETDLSDHPQGALVSPRSGVGRIEIQVD